MSDFLKNCTLCPRKCGADRTKSTGICGASDNMEVSKIMLHQWEEPCISGRNKDRGSGAVFFTHCPLGCIYCQNREISGSRASGQTLSEEQLAERFLELQKRGAYNINLVTPTHYTVQLVQTVSIARKKGLTLPIVWNTGGYERPETIEMLQGTVDIFLTDFKYLSPALSGEFSHAPDYGEICAASLVTMLKIAGRPKFDADGMMKKGVILRHLVLPGCRNDSIAILRKTASVAVPEDIKLSLMSQYTPDFFTQPENASPAVKKLSRRITSFEYDSVVEEAVKLGFDGYTQEKNSASSRYTPDFQNR